MKNECCSFTVLIILFTFSCSQVDDSTSGSDIISINIELESSNEPIYFSEFLTNYKIIPLQTIKESTFSRIDEIILHKDLIFIFDCWNTKSLYIFDYDGKFVNKINRVGRGAGEYIRPTSFDLIQDENSITIFDWATRKVNFYSYDGDYIKSLQLDKRFKSIISHEKGIIGYLPPSQHTDNSEKLLYRFDEKGKLQFRCINFNGRSGKGMLLQRGSHFFKS